LTGIAAGDIIQVEEQTGRKRQVKRFIGPGRLGSNVAVTFERDVPLVDKKEERVRGLANLNRWEALS
jgi:hypothetical protein